MKDIPGGFMVGMVRRCLEERNASAAVEFALVGLAFFAFIFGIINLGLLGLTLGMLQHATELTARHAAVVAAAAGNGACPSTTTINGYFNNYAAPIIPANAATATYKSYATGSVTTVSGTNPWITSGSGTSATTYIALTETYSWRPIGFSKFTSIPSLQISTVAFAMGAPACSTVN